jgi:hypothetical protein
MAHVSCLYHSFVSLQTHRPQKGVSFVLQAAYICAIRCSFYTRSPCTGDKKRGAPRKRRDKRGFSTRVRGPKRKRKHTHGCDWMTLLVYFQYRDSHTLQKYINTQLINNMKSRAIVGQYLHRSGLTFLPIVQAIFSFHHQKVTIKNHP